MSDNYYRSTALINDLHPVLHPGVGYSLIGLLVLFHYLRFESVGFNNLSLFILMECIMDHTREKISVLIVDDHPPIRAGLRAMIERTDDIHLVGEAQNDDEARRLLDELRPRIILLDLVMPGFSPFAFENGPARITLIQSRWC